MSKLAALLTNAESKFAGYLKEHKIDPQRVMIASEHIESLRPEDRKIKLSKRQARGKDDDAAKKKMMAAKPRSGRPVTRQLITRAIKGETITGPQKSRIVRAIGRVAEQKKLSAVELANLF